MFKTILKHTKDLILSVSIFGSALYGYIYYHSKQNEERYLEGIKSQTLRDASRLSNESFGISWGFQADDTIMSRIDSGDLLFLRFECYQCLTPAAMIDCYLTTAHYIEEEYQSMGCAFRDGTGLYVVYHEFGQTKVKSYCELVSLPYIKSLTLQKRNKNLLKAHLNLRKEIDFDAGIKESSQEFLNRINKLIGTQNRRVKSVQDFITGEQTINIRTETNSTLRSL